MVEGRKYKVLSDGSVLQKQAKDENLAEGKFQCKKHGIWCRIKTRLGLRKRSKGKNRETLREEEIGCGEKDLLITAESRESLVENNEEFAYRGATVHVAKIADSYKLLKEVESDSLLPPIEKLSLQDPQGDDNVPRDEEKLIQHEKDKTLKEYLAKKWRGKKAKRVRKSIRVGARSSIKYLESATSNIQTIFPDATSIAAAAARRNQQRNQ